MRVRPIVEARDRLGEGPCWSAAESRLYWFDIKGRCLHWLDAAGADDIPLPFLASAAAPRAQGGLLMATDAGLATFDPAARHLEVVRPMAFAPGFRTNDGKTDPLGRFWWSTMDDDGGTRPGAIHVTEPDLSTSCVIEGIHIANATAFSADGATLYLADSKLQTIFAYDTSDLSQRRVFSRTPGEAAPDGAAMDAEGGLWVAEWGGWRVVRHTPDGAIDRVVDLPVEQPTCCAFGGPDLATLYITSAWDGLSDASRADQPLAGALFAVEPGVTGQPIPAFQG
jgi:sugar lactone lactonase YvrE